MTEFICFSMSPTADPFQRATLEILVLLSFLRLLKKQYHEAISLFLCYFSNLSHYEMGLNARQFRKLLEKCKCKQS